MGRRKSKMLNPEERLPLRVLYEDGDSWFYKPDKKPIAVFLIPDQLAIYVRDMMKSRYIDARDSCFSLRVQNYLFRPPTIEELYILKENRSSYDRIAKLLRTDQIKPGKYWSSTHGEENGYRKVLNFLPSEELVLHELQFAYVRPFLCI